MNRSEFLRRLAAGAAVAILPPIPHWVDEVVAQERARIVSEARITCADGRVFTAPVYEKILSDSAGHRQFEVMAPDAINPVRYDFTNGPSGDLDFYMIPGDVLTCTWNYRVT